MAKADEIYHGLLKDILSMGKTKEDRTKTGTTSVFSKQVQFNMQDGFPLLTTKKIHTKSIIYELLWFLRGDTNIKYLQSHGVTIWDEWADENGDLGPVYGKQWRDWGSGALEDKYLDNIDQITDVINTLKAHPDCRRMVVNTWNVGELDQMVLPPCHWAFELYTEELTANEYSTAVGGIGQNMIRETVDMDNSIPRRRLSLKWHQRSVDTFLGLPFNIASYAFLLHMFAQQANMIPGTLIGDLTNVHIYDNHIEYVKEQLTRNTNKRAPRLKLTKADDIYSYKYEDFKILDYEADPNWKAIPIAI